MLGLSEKELQSGRRVELRGVVTFVDPDWNLLTLQDETGGVPIEMTRRTPPLSRGDLMEVSGATAADNQVPMVVSPVLHVAGRSKLPSPLAAPAASLSCGEHLYRLVEIEVRPEQGQLGAILMETLPLFTKIALAPRGSSYRKLPWMPFA